MVFRLRLPKLIYGEMVNRMKKKIRILGVLLLLLVMLVLAVPANATAEAYFRIDADPAEAGVQDTRTVSVGVPFEVQVMVDLGALSVGGAQAYLAYDTGVFSVESVEKPFILGWTLKLVEDYPTEGYVHIWRTGVGMNDGEIVLADITFMPLAVATDSALTFMTVDPTETGLVVEVQPPLTFQGASITVDAGGPSTVVSVTAPENAVEGESFTVAVNIAQVDDLDACDYAVTFDPAVLRLDDVTAGTIAGTAIPVSQINESVPGTVTVVQNLGGTEGVSGVGSLATLHFTAIGSGGDTSTIALVDGTLSDTLANAITATWPEVTVSVITIVYGDANTDGQINAQDITKVERIVAQLDTQTLQADANQDGSINALDITKTERLVAGLD
ncbi:cohesin domain-containing protein [Chloroflexota bacterium]